MRGEREGEADANECKYEDESDILYYKCIYRYAYTVSVMEFGSKLCRACCRAG